MSAARQLAALALCAALAGCGAQPWQRGVLAKPEMLPEGDAVIEALDDHVQFSKESVSGGRSFGGGGCGCN